MATEAIGFISQLGDGTWTQIRATKADAEALVTDLKLPVRRNRVALPVSVDVPDAPARPSVTLPDGTRIVWRQNRNTYRIGLVEYPSLVALIKDTAVPDDAIDALQALPSDTAAWAATGGRE